MLFFYFKSGIHLLTVRGWWFLVDGWWFLVLG